MMDRVDCRGHSSKGSPRGRSGRSPPSCARCSSQRARRGARSPTTWASRSASVHLMIEGRETTESVLTQVVETAPGQPLSMVAGARERRAPVQPRPLRGRARRRDARRTDASRCATSSSRSIRSPGSDLRSPPSAPGIDADALRRAIVDRYGTSPPLGARRRHDAHHRRHAPRARLPACRRSSPRSEIEHAPERATLVFTIDPGARTTIGERRRRRPAARAARESFSRLGLAPGAPYQREALNARIERYIEERRAAATTKREIAPAVELADDDRVANLTLTVTPGSARARRVRRRSAAVRSPRRAGAGRARRLGRRGSARGLDQPDRGVLARAGLSRRGRAAHARGRRTAS